MSEVTMDEKVRFIKQLFPKQSYSLDELAIFFKCSKSNIKYWIEIYEVPTIKVTGSPFVLQVNLINMFLVADKKNRSEDKRVGLEFVLNDINKLSK